MTTNEREAITVALAKVVETTLVVLIGIAGMAMMSGIGWLFLKLMWRLRP